MSVSDAASASSNRLFGHPPTPTANPTFGLKFAVDQGTEAGEDVLTAVQISDRPKAHTWQIELDPTLSLDTFYQREQSGLLESIKVKTAALGVNILVANIIQQEDERMKSLTENLRDLRRFSKTLDGIAVENHFAFPTKARAAAAHIAIQLRDISDKLILLQESSSETVGTLMNNLVSESHYLNGYNIAPAETSAAETETKMTEFCVVKPASHTA